MKIDTKNFVHLTNQIKVRPNPYLDDEENAKFHLGDLQDTTNDRPSVVNDTLVINNNSKRNLRLGKGAAAVTTSVVAPTATTSTMGGTRTVCKSKQLQKLDELPGGKIQYMPITSATVTTATEKSKKE